MSREPAAAIRERAEHRLLKRGEPLKLWNGMLLDSHNRLAICKKHGGLPYATADIEGIESREDAKIWIIRNQG